MSKARHQLGFTFVELLITVAILALLGVFAAPSFMTQIERRRVIGAANEMSTDIQYARSLSVSKKSDVTLATQSTSVYTITDSLGNQYKTVTMPTGVSVTANATVTFSSLNGFLSNTVNTVTFSLSSSNNASAAQIQTSYMGRVTMVCGASGSQRSLC